MFKSPPLGDSLKKRRQLRRSSRPNLPTHSARLPRATDYISITLAISARSAFPNQSASSVLCRDSRRIRQPPRSDFGPFWWEQKCKYTLNVTWMSGLKEATFNVLFVKVKVIISVSSKTFGWVDNGGHCHLSGVAWKRNSLVICLPVLGETLLLEKVFVLFEQLKADV